MKSIKELLREEFNKADYLKWKKANVTYRGMKDSSIPNADAGEFHGETLGKGLYSAPLSNKAMAKGYGDLYFALNAKPTKPLVFNTLNEWEIWFYNTVIKKFGNRREFNANSTIEKEILNLGYNGVIIKGREMVNYEPEDVKYFRHENGLIDYYERLIQN